MNGLLPHAPSNLPVMQPLSRNALPAGSGGIRPPRMPQGLGSSPSAAIHQNMRSSGSQPPLPEGSDVGHMHSRQSPGLLNGELLLPGIVADCGSRNRLGWCCERNAILRLLQLRWLWVLSRLILLSSAEVCACYIQCLKSFMHMPG